MSKQSKKLCILYFSQMGWIFMEFEEKSCKIEQEFGYISNKMMSF